jgi:tRNA-dihydrouridine synthase
MEIAWKENEQQGIIEMRRHYSNYFKNIENFKEHRLKMVTATTLPDLQDVFDSVLQQYA